jgi:serine/threonine-protein kinase
VSDEALVLDRYRLEQQIAIGGSAEVWRAFDTQLQRAVAVKLLHAHLLPDATSRARLEAEARSVAALSHPGIVAIYDVDVRAERPAIVFELVEGESLAARLAAGGPLLAEAVVRIGAEIADALFHAHQRGVIHRDVKPGNILLDTAGRARLVDFGIAHSLEAAAERLTVTGTVIGTPRYMAPEQLADGPIGPRTDLYSLGAVLYEALAGRPAWPSASPVAVAAAQREGPLPLTDVDADLAAIITESLAFDPADRPRTAAVLASDLRAWQPATVVSAAVAAPDDNDETVASSAVPVRQADSGGERSRPPRRPSWMAPALLAGAVIIVLAFGVSALLRGGGPTAPGPSLASAQATATPAETPVATQTPAPTLDLGTLSRPVQRAIERYREACGEDAPLPEGIESMKKKDAEDALDPLTAACEQSEG